MPRYRYVCEICDVDQTAYHLYDDTPRIECKSCSNVMIRALTRPYIASTVEQEHTVAVGQLTEEYIKKNRDILDAEKKEHMEKTYEPT